ncbi:MAG: thiopeptide-type bacteriocin biosynthesis protein [Pseudomonas sp.]|nr:thiopeptide-type bacteriocin biosynthesis protein [Pseudomonas sp.]
MTSARCYDECRAIAVRRASGGLSELKSLLSCRTRDDAWNELEKLLADPLFVESVLLSSHSVASELRIDAGRAYVKNANDRLLDTLFAYALRFCGRTTPMGTWASVGFIEQGKGGNETPGVYGRQRIVLLDWEWVVGVAKTIEDHCLSALRFSVNPSARIKGSQLELWAGPQIQGIAPPRRLALTAFEERIASRLAEAPDSGFTEILGNSDWAAIEPGELTRLLRVMLQKGVIVSNAIPVRATYDACDTFAEIVRNAGWDTKLANRLEALSLMIREYEEASGFSAVEELLVIDETMREIHPSNGVLNVMLLDGAMIAPKIDRQVSCILPDLRNALAVSTIASPKNNHWVYKGSYVDLFRSAYGDYRHVDLFDLLNEDMGIGIPDHFKEHRHEKRRAAKLKYSATPRGAIRHTVTLDSIFDLIDDCISGNHRNGARESDDIACQDELGDIELIGAFVRRGNQAFFRCSPDFARPGYRSVMSRFYPWAGHIDNEEFAMADATHDHARRERSMCDLAFLPHRHKLANVMDHGRTPRPTINIWPNTTSYSNEIDLSSIQVGFDGTRLRLYSKEAGEPLSIAITDCLGGSGEEALIRFLRATGSEDVRPVIGISWTDFARGQKHTPEIRVGRVILIPEMWLIASFGQKEYGLVELVDDVEKVRQHGCPNRVGLLSGDCELPINLDHPCCMSILMQEFRKTGSIILTRIDEYDPVENEVDCQPRAYDLVVRVQHEKKRRPNECGHAPNASSYCQDHTAHQPCSKWLSLEIRGFPLGQNYFLAREGQELISWMLEKKGAKLFHFLRYANPLSHLRLRFKRQDGFWSSSPDDLCSIIVKLDALTQSGCIGEYSLVPYRPEFGRYHGEQAVAIAEQIFHHDSLLAIGANQVELESHERDLLATLVGLSYYRAFALSDQRSIRKDDIPKAPDWYIDANRAELNREYGLIKNAIRKRAWIDKPGTQRFRYLTAQLAPLISATHDLAALLNESQRCDVLASLIHLSSNRMLQMGVEHEYRIRALMRHHYQQLDLLLSSWLEQASVDGD